MQPSGKASARAARALGVISILPADMSGDSPARQGSGRWRRASRTSVVDSYGVNVPYSDQCVVPPKWFAG
jgi:hypothetical protein